MTQKLYKVLNSDSTDCRGVTWSLPKGQQPGDWMPMIHGELELYANGYHLRKVKGLIKHIDIGIYEAEFRGEYHEDGEFVIAREARLVEKLDWHEGKLRLFAADCAERSLFAFEKKHPRDKRPRRAVQAAREFASMNISKKKLGDVNTDAELAAWFAKGTAAESAAWATVSVTATDVPLHDIATRAAAEAASAISTATSTMFIQQPDWKTVWERTWNDECEWQTEKLLEYLYR